MWSCGSEWFVGAEIRPIQSVRLRSHKKLLNILNIIGVRLIQKESGDPGANQARGLTPSAPLGSRGEGTFE